MEEDIRKRYSVGIKEVETRPGCWNVLDVAVFMNDGEKKTQIGSYQRNYSSFFNTFCPFTRNGKDYALYSPNYTSTRIMSLPDCKDIGGEEPDGDGFCPVDLYVPIYRKGLIIVEGDEMNYYLVDDECFDSEQLEGKVGEVDSCDFGFVAGKTWGPDDYSIQFIDLSEAEKGIIKRDDRFEGIILPRGKRLKDVIDMEDWEPGRPLRIAHTDWFNIDGKKIDW